MPEQPSKMACGLQWWPDKIAVGPGTMSEHLVHNLYKTNHPAVHLPCLHMKGETNGRNHHKPRAMHVIKSVWAPTSAMDFNQDILLLGSTHSFLWRSKWKGSELLTLKTVYQMLTKFVFSVRYNCRKSICLSEIISWFVQYVWEIMICANRARILN